MEENMMVLISNHKDSFIPMIFIMRLILDLFINYLENVKKIDKCIEMKKHKESIHKKK